MQAFSCAILLPGISLVMGKIGKGKKQLGVVLATPLAKVIEDRATALGITRSRFAALIIEQWAKDGHTPVNEPDKLLLISKKSIAYSSSRS